MTSPAAMRRLARLEERKGAQAPPDAASVLASAATVRAVEETLFEAQRLLFKDKASYKTAVCSRRAGKTVGCAAALLASAKERPGSVNLYITKSRKNAKRIIWRTLLDLNREYGLGGEPNETELHLRFPNGSFIYLAGANDKSEIENFRGLAIALAVIDECQSLPPYIKELIDEVLAPALMDFDGSLILIGTPGPVPVGYFHECATSPNWSHHEWTVWDNPHIERKSGRPVQYHLDKEMKRRGIKSVEDPVIQREWFARWIHDPNSLVFRYDASINTFDELPTVSAPWQHVIGVDLGFEDADAISVLAFNDDSPNAYQVHEWVGAKQSITGLKERLQPLVATYSPLSVVWDTGGLGKKIAEEVSPRIGVPMKAAEKDRKYEFIEILNDALRSKRMFVKRDSQFAADSMLVEWEINREKQKRVISGRFHSDIADAILYAFRESLHWLHEPPGDPPPEAGSLAWQQAQEAAMLERAQEQVRNRIREREEDAEWGYDA